MFLSDNQVSPSGDTRPLTRSRVLGSKFTIVILGLVTVLAFSSNYYFIYQYFEKKDIKLEEGKQKASQLIRENAKSLSIEMKKLMPSVDYLEKEISNSKDSIKEKLKTVYLSNQNYWEVGYAIQPYDNNPEARESLHYGIKRKQEQYFELSYDYLKYNWYNGTMSEPNGHWIEPYFGSTTQKLVAGYAKKFTTGNQDGVIRVNISLETIRDLVNSLNLGKNGYGFLVSKKGTYLSHPQENFVTAQQKFYETTKNSDSFKQAVKSLTPSYEDEKDPISGQESWIFSHPIEGPDWTLFGVFYKDETSNLSNLKKSKIIIVLNSTLTLCLFSAFVFLILKKVFNIPYWFIVKVQTIILLAGNIFIWNIATQKWNYNHNKGRLVIDQPSLNHFINEQKKLTESNHRPDPKFIPTGVFIQSMEFSSAHNVNLTGYIWNKYHKEKHAGLQQGLIFPESVEIATYEETYRKEEKDGLGGIVEVVGWYFEATLRQNFDYSLYPMDHKDIWLRLWHKDFSKNVILVPDLTSYNMINPYSKPGLEEDFVLSGWKIISSYFDYQYRNYNSNFGISDYIGKEKFPELYFNIHARRQFSDAFITNLIPLAIVASLLFFILLMFTTKEKKQSLYDFNFCNVLSANSALFFLIMLAHIQLRRELTASGVFYIEYFYFILYVMIFFITTNAYFYINKQLDPSKTNSENPWPKYLFWPANSLLVLVVTTIHFY